MEAKMVRFWTINHKHYLVLQVLARFPEGTLVSSKEMKSGLAELSKINNLSRYDRTEWSRVFKALNDFGLIERKRHEQNYFLLKKYNSVVMFCMGLKGILEEVKDG